MMTGKQIWIMAGVATGLTGIGLYMYYQDREKKKVVARQLAASLMQSVQSRPSKPITPKQTIVPAKPEFPKGDGFPLRLGSEGKRVERLQVWLMRNFGGVGTVNGKFDKTTEERLLRYLKTRELNEETYNKYRMEKPVYEQIIK
ncbi:hypothetical protein JMN32_00085 [Fulvivirga sp. 29W222]|uniref:Peptidoglycan binding-like domain-containing protein n=1 Tax=Fulvivirga marina TaxID=2494733 RepID=A0A937FSQ5_9BACT|nr:hypothetical protein [Fulvivirga marina]MBL6444685.1 hypothetical protein [Fulvivirga marina]